MRSETSGEANMVLCWLSVDPLAEKFPSWSPYSFVFNNPMRFIDPDGREPFDWIKKGNTVFYDATIKTQADAVAVYGNDAKHMGEGSKTYSTTNGVDNGNYSYAYHDNGTVTDKNGTQVDFSNGNLTTAGGTTIVSPESKKGSYFGIGIGGSLGGGISLEIGVVKDATGNYGGYFSFGGNFGLSADAGWKGGEVKPTGRNPFGLNDFAGKGNSYSGGLGPFSGEIGGSDGSKEAGVSRMNPQSFGKNPRGYTFDNAGTSFITPGPKISVGAQFTGSKTWVWDF